MDFVLCIFSLYILGGDFLIFGKHINRYYLRYSPVLLLGFLALLLVDYMQLVIPELYQLVINGISNGKVIKDGVAYSFDMNFVLEHICSPMLIVILGLVFGRFLWRICFFGSGIKVETDLRSRMFDRCKDLSQQYYQVNKVGNLMSFFTNDLETVQECFGWGIMMFFDAVVLGIMAIIKMARMNLSLTLLCLIPMAFLLAASLIVGKYMTQKWDKRQAAFSSLSDFAQETFAGIAVVKAFVKEAHELWQFKKLSKNNEDTNVDYTKLSMLLHVCLTLFIETVVCVIIGYGGYLVYTQTFDAGKLVEFIGYFNAIIWPVMAVSELIGMHAQGKASLKRISELLDAEIDVKDSQGAERIDNIKGNIEFRNLTFCYPGDEERFDALTNVSFKINAGENVGIIGRTGSGKTTLVDLILRTYNVPDGTLFIDGKDINTISIKSVRAAAAYVPQDNFLFSDTIENNIAFASDDVSSDKIELAAKMADVHDNIVDFPEQYKSVLGERGVTVSGGQKQRISIARALMKDAPILILDDSVSAVDVKTEKTILQNLRDMRKGKTTILIAHRISTIEQMDKIIFIDKGAVVDVGRHMDLYERCPDYRNMVDLQRLDDADSKEEVSANA
ncbi:MAG: ABC transporter ATP-binding protein [Ruminococcaceae bacterium]|nr:ABC transporter ATP-binding protein [Oscillospiraceae bacterium]